MSNPEGAKKELGQFFTATDPFEHEAFKTWAHQFPKDTVILEPFAGANHLIDMLQKQGLAHRFTSCDVEPAHKDVRKRDTLKSFPKGHDVCVTNPPYLAKNSATRTKTAIPDLKGYDNLWKLSIHLCLEHCGYVAAIIPESFITSKVFKDRLFAVISLPFTMFNDTEQPSCLALWNPEATVSYKIYSGDTLLGTNVELANKVKKMLPRIREPRKIVFNDPQGSVGILAADNTKKATISFVLGSSIPESEIKVSSRLITRVSIESDMTPQEIVDEANRLLHKYRKETGDVFLTSFKGLRDDGKFRRRLDWATARKILQQAVHKPE